MTVSVSVLVPYRPGPCPWRERAWEHVRAHYTAHHPGWEMVVGSCDGNWSKGAAVADAHSRAAGDVLVLADADSITTPDILRAAIEGVAGGRHSWAVPHGRVYRLDQQATETVYAGGPVRLGRTVRPPYLGPAGGGVVVVTRAAYETVGGIDPRFAGWGGEDVSLGWALETLVGGHRRHGARLVHLWHPHPAPTLRGSPESEALVAHYRAARGRPDLMSALVRREAVR